MLRIISQHFSIISTAGALVVITVYRVSIHPVTQSPIQTELQKRADRADQSVLFFLAGATFWDAREKQAKTRKNRRKTGAFLVLIFWGEKLVGANFYAFCNYASRYATELMILLNLFFVFLYEGEKY